MIQLILKSAAMLAAIFLSLSTICYAAEDDVWVTIDKANEQIRLKEYDRAIQLLEPVSDRNIAAANSYYDAHLLSHKKQEYIQKVRKAADSGNPIVSFFLARALSEYPLEPLEIERYYRNAHEGGFVLATEMLGHIYYGGLTSNSISETKPRVSRNLEKAKAMFEACSGDEIVGLACTEGLGHVLFELNPNQPQMAIAQFEKAKAYGTLWSIYYFGIGVAQNARIARSYREKAIELLRIDKNFRGNYGCLVRVRDSATGLDSGDPKALVDIAYGFNMSTIGQQRAACFPAKPRLFIDLLERAASAGSMYAVKELANHYWFGDILPKDYVLAYMYSSILSVVGNQEQRQEGMDRLEMLEKYMSKSAIQEAQLRFREWQSKRSTIAGHSSPPA